MTPARLAGLLCGLLALAFIATLGVKTGASLLLGLGVVASTAWLSPKSVKVMGPLCLFLLSLLLLRLRFDWPGAISFAGLIAFAGYRFAGLSVLRRITFIVPSLILLVFVTTLLMYSAPGNPFAQERAQSAQVQEALRQQYGVPESALEFFQIYMRRLVIDGTLGPSIKVKGRMVEDLIAPALPVSISLGLTALALALGLGLFLGIRAGLRPNSLSDHASMTVAMAGISLPNFVIGAGLMMLLSLKLRILPVAGWGSPGHLVMPAVTLALPYAAYIARLARNATLDVMHQDFIRTARAKGLPERTVVFKHALGGILLPVVSFLGPAAAGILTGSFVVETLFGIPGMGQWFVKGAINRDYSVVLGSAVLYSGLITAFNLAVDLIYSWLDPRVRHEI